MTPVCRSAPNGAAEDDFHADDTHWTQLGHAAVAEELRTYLAAPSADGTGANSPAPHKGARKQRPAVARRQRTRYCGSRPWAMRLRFSRHTAERRWTVPKDVPAT